MYTLRKQILVIWLLILSAGQAKSQFLVHADATQLSCTCYQLTPDAGNQVGAVWNTTLIDLNDPFDFTFTVFLGCDPGTWTGADGIVFGLQRNGTSVGVLGGGQGLGGVTPSLGVFIDTYSNPADNDLTNDHISINSNGDVDHSSANNLAGPYDLGEVEDCEDDTLRVVWDPAITTYTVYYNGTLVLTHVGDIINTVFGGDPMVYWGFTGATGGADNEQRFCLDLTANFSNNIVTTNGCLYDTIQFVDESTSTLGAMSSWNWDFGDGTTSTQQNPQHVYDSSAAYNAILTVTDASGCEEVDTVPVLISSHQIEATVFDDTLCLGSQTNLNVSLTPGVPIPCDYTFSMIDLYGDGWNGASMDILVNGVSMGSFTAADQGGVWNPSTENITFSVLNGDAIQLDYTAGTSEVEVVWELYDASNVLLNTDGPFPATGTNVYTTTAVCNTGVTYNYTWVDASIVTDATISNPATNITTTSQFIVSVSDNLGCDAVDSVGVFIHNVQGPGSDGATTVCTADPSFDLFSELTGTPGSGGVWVNADQTPVSNIFDPSTDTSATLTYILTNGGVCPDSTAEVVVTVIPNPNAGTNGTLALCEEGTEESMFVSLGGTPDSNGVWTNATGVVVDSLYTPTVDMPGIYYYTVSNALCGDSIAEVNVSLNPTPEVAFSITDVSCNGGTDGQIDLQNTIGTSPYVINWSNGSTGNQNGNLTAGTFIVTVTDDNGCVLDTNTTVQEPVIMSYTLVEVNPTCNSSCDGSVSLFPTGGVSPYTYSWLGTNAVSDVASGLCSGVYQATIFDDNNCELMTTSVTLASTDSLVAAFTSSSDSGTVALTVDFTNQSQGTGTGTTYEWNMDVLGFALDENPSFVFNEAGIFEVEFIVTNQNGCTDTAFTTIRVKEEFISTIPMVFSPNGDGQNELFYLKIDNLQEINVDIYNRWGVQVGAYDITNGGWDGTTAAGAAVPPGTYFYTANYSSISEGDQVKTGAITLVR